MKYFGSLSNSLLTFCKDCRLSSNLFKSPDDLLISVYETVKRIWYPHVSAKLLHEFLSSAKVVSWHPREQMVNSLELQAAVEEIKPLRTIDIHRRS